MRVNIQAVPRCYERFNSNLMKTLCSLLFTFKKSILIYYVELRYNKNVLT